MNIDRTKFEVQKPVPLDGPFNFRELGGYPAKGGKIAKGRFFRSDALDRLSEKDRNYLLEKGITCVIDLRAEEEIRQKPDALSPEFEYHPVSMADDLYNEKGEIYYPPRMSDVYFVLLKKYQAEFAKIMHILAERDGKPAVFHCAVGKDRTGLTAMFLLSIAGTPEDIILRDYEPSSQNMKPVFDRVRQIAKSMQAEVPEAMLSSEPDEMRRAMDFIRDNWGDPVNYLRNAGVLENDLEKLRKNLVVSE